MIVINFQPVKLEDKAIFDNFFRKERYETSECTFTNLYMWRQAYGIEWAIMDDLLCIKASYNGAPFVLPPYGRHCVGLDKVLDALSDYFVEHNQPFLMKGVSISMRDCLERRKPGSFNYQEDRNNYDYVYLAKDLIELTGRKYTTKKNHLNHFKNNYSGYRYEPITPDIIDRCMEASAAWYENHEGVIDTSLAYEKVAIQDVLNHFNFLGITGGVVIVDGKIEAFTLGEKLNNDMAVVHIEKGNPAIRGVYQMINQEFCRHAWQDVTYINREEDMGLPGLRRAKESYRPVRMIEKYIVTLK